MASFDRSGAGTAVIGGGPVGCLAAVALARKGERVVLLEGGDPKPDRKFAGEWLHPTGLDILEKYDIPLDELSPAECSRGRGFVVFPDDGSEPVRLEYAGGGAGLVCDHLLLLRVLRKAMERTEGVEFIPHARVNRVEPGFVEYVDSRSGTSRRLEAGRIVGADGRGSVVRTRLLGPRQSVLVSYMAGVTLEDTELPFEGFGHVILGGLGPILLYRISATSVRACIDFPAKPFRHAKDKKRLLAESCAPFFPECVRESFIRALEREPFSLRVNQFTPRTYYGTEMFPLVGDAVGHHHPLTAMGMTLGFQDAECLARAGSFREFERERLALSYVPEFLAAALYEAFSQSDGGARSVRRAIFRMCRNHPVERDRTTSLLCGAETSFVRFVQCFARGMSLAVCDTVEDSWRRKRPGGLATARAIGRLLLLLGSLLSSRLASLAHLRPLASGAGRPAA